ncbi:MAG: hypothetical protein HRT47_06340 [Candidatus Caenarcaniphilales bacterium]|nr:hypothetical protein [Candidatus Caenarcaniphilales bacterium]
MAVTPTINKNLLNDEMYRMSKNSAYKVRYRSPEKHFNQPMSLTEVDHIDRSGTKKKLNAASFNFSENSFKAFDKLFQHLDKIFRGKGNTYIPQKHSSTADHSIGVMNLADDFVFSKLPEALKDIVPKIRAGIIMHDFGELSGEISTMFQRLTGAKNDLSGNPILEDSRRGLEANVVSLLFYKALETVYTGDNSFFDSEFKNLQQNMNNEQDQYERFTMVEKFIKKHENEVADLNKDSRSFEIPEAINSDQHEQFKQDLNSLLDAYKITLEPKDNLKSGNLLWSFVKFFDKAEAEAYVSDVAIIDDNKKDFTKFLAKPIVILDSIKDIVNHGAKQFEKLIAANIEEFLENIRSVYVTKQNNVEPANSQP